MFYFLTLNNLTLLPWIQLNLNMVNGMNILCVRICMYVHILKWYLDVFGYCNRENHIPVVSKQNRKKRGCLFHKQSVTGCKSGNFVVCANLLVTQKGGKKQKPAFVGHFKMLIPLNPSFRIHVRQNRLNFGSPCLLQ